jgi:Uncharacterized conserved protein
MDAITENIEVSIPIQQSFDLFVNRLTLWWPPEYTWSGDKLVELRIDPIPNGLCSEIGPNGFRCDWGTVTAIAPQQHISFKWQISATRSPLPDPDGASEVQVSFRQLPGQRTLVELIHKTFSNHGEGFEAYRNAMASAHGWPYILSAFARYAETTR